MQDPKKLIAFLKELKALCDEHRVDLYAGTNTFTNAFLCTFFRDLDFDQDAFEFDDIDVAIAQLEDFDA